MKLGSSALLLAAFLGLGASACVQTENQRKENLRDGVEELLPQNARVLVLDYGDCVELAASPSCASVVFEMPERDPAERAAQIRAKAKDHGWTVTHSDDAPGGWSVFTRRGDFTAAAFLWRPEVYGVNCKNHPDPESESERVCFNTLNIER